MGEEINNNKIYFKDEDGNMEEIGTVKGLELADYEIEDNKMFFKNFNDSIEFEFTIDMKAQIQKYRKRLGYNILKPKRFKKLLMSIGFDKNEAEWINENFKFYGKHRYERFINGYKDLVPGIKKYINEYLGGNICV